MPLVRTFNVQLHNLTLENLDLLTKRNVYSQLFRATFSSLSCLIYFFKACHFQPLSFQYVKWTVALDFKQLLLIQQWALLEVPHCVLYPCFSHSSVRMDSCWLRQNMSF